MVGGLKLNGYLDDPCDMSVSLVATDFGPDPSAVTRLIGLEPTSLASSGCTGVEGIDAEWAKPKRSTSWSYNLQGPQSESLDGQIEALLHVLEARATGVRTVARQYRALVSVSVESDVYRDDDTVLAFGSAEIPSALLARIAALGLGLRCHFSTPDPSGGVIE